MRTLVQPPPTSHCEICHGELQLKWTEPAAPSVELDVEIFVCTKCSHEQSYWVGHDLYAAHTTRKMPLSKVD
jgi:uncharacterized protein with PIN domain